MILAFALTKFTIKLYSTVPVAVSALATQ